MTDRHTVKKVEGLRCANTCWGVWDRVNGEYITNETGSMFVDTLENASLYAKRLNKRRYIVAPVDWLQYASGETDYRKPVAWAVKDSVSKQFFGTIWYMSEQSAQSAADIFNGRKV